MKNKIKKSVILLVMVLIVLGGCDSNEESVSKIIESVVDLNDVSIHVGYNTDGDSVIDESSDTIEGNFSNTGLSIDYEVLDTNGDNYLENQEDYTVEIKLKNISDYSIDIDNFKIGVNLESSDIQNTTIKKVSSTAVEKSDFKIQKGDGIIVFETSKSENEDYATLFTLKPGQEVNIKYKTNIKNDIGYDSNEDGILEIPVFSLNFVGYPENKEAFSVQASYNFQYLDI